MALIRTVLLDFELIETSPRNRTSIQDDNVAYLSSNGLNIREGSLAAGAQLVLNGITGVLYLRCSNPLQVKINNSDYFTVAALFVNFGSINSATVFNASTADVNYKIVDS